MKRGSNVVSTTFHPAQLAKATDGSQDNRRRKIRYVADFARNESGAVAIIAGLSIPVLLGFAGLALEYGQILGVRAEAQRTADFAAHAGAVAYSRTGEIGPMVAAAQAVARLNGFSDTEITVVLDGSVPNTSNSGVRATIKTPKPLYLPRLVGGDSSVDVVASALAGARAGEPACVQALDPNGRGILLSGGARLRSDKCGVASNAEVEAPCGTEITTSSLTYDAGDNPLPEWCDTIIGPDGETANISRTSTSDPLADSDAIQLARLQMAQTRQLDAPDLHFDVDAMSVATGPDIDFGWTPSNTKAQAEAAGCTATLASSVWTFACAGLSEVNLGTITIGGGLSLRFNPGASQGIVYNLSGSILNTANSMTFPPGTYNVGQDIYSAGNSVTEFGAGTFRVGGSIRNDGQRMIFGDGSFDVAEGIVTYGGSETRFGAGTYRIGRASQTCENAKFSVCNKGDTLSFAGPSEFILPGGIQNNYGDLTLGSGSGNSFRFGPSSAGDAISIGGGSDTYMGDADDGGVFEIVGHVDGGGGGSCLILPAADLHEINGSVLVSGAVRFGAGPYVIEGNMHFGAGGGSIPCGGESISINAIDTTFLISANGSDSISDDCIGQALCFTSGYSNVRFTATQSGALTDLMFIGPLDTSRSAGALFTSGASDSVVSGAFYFQNGPIETSGAGSASSSGTGCLQLIGTEIIMSGGSSLASECDLPNSGSNGRVVILR